MCHCQGGIVNVIQNSLLPCLFHKPENPTYIIRMEDLLQGSYIMYINTMRLFGGKAAWVHQAHDTEQLNLFYMGGIAGRILSGMIHHVTAVFL